MLSSNQDFINFAEQLKSQYLIHAQMCIDSGTNDSIIKLYHSFAEILSQYIEISYKEQLAPNYLNKFQADVNEGRNYLPYINQSNNNFIVHNERYHRGIFESYKDNLERLLDRLSFNLSFFKKIGFYNSNVVAIGANGSGKSTLSNKLKIDIQNNGVVISAQRVLLVPSISSIGNVSTTIQKLKQFQTIDKTNKNTQNFSYLQQEFEVILRHLIADNIFLSNKYKMESLERQRQGLQLLPPPISNLDNTIRIWNSLIEHRSLSCIDGMDIKANFGKNEYNAIKLSDGEKVMLFLIAQVLQAPQSGFVIIDEPEMYLHKTILKKLWDRLEKERNDCIFIYLTHDLDFASSRTTAKKIWIKSFTHPEHWEIEPIPENELPLPLILELVGSRKDIFFCEGEKGSIDEKIYNILFPNYTITPVGSCFHVINYTKAFNKISAADVNALGVIDSDHHSEDRLKKLKMDCIYNFSVAEIENLLLDEKFLLLLASSIMAESEDVKRIKEEIIKSFDKNKEQQAASFTSNQIDYYFKDSNVKKANTKNDLKEHFDAFLKEVNLEAIYNDRIEAIKKIIEDNDYGKTICSYNNKGLKSIVNNQFRISDFTDRAIKLLQMDESTHEHLLKYFPVELNSSI